MRHRGMAMTTADEAGGSWVIRAAVFKGEHGVYAPIGADRGSKRKGRPLHPPPRYAPPRETTYTVRTHAAALALAAELRARHPDIALVIEPAAKPAAAPRPRQALLPGDWPHTGFRSRRGRRR
jgi:hypothetical protein